MNKNYVFKRPNNYIVTDTMGNKTKRNPSINIHNILKIENILEVLDNFYKKEQKELKECKRIVKKNTLILTGLLLSLILLYIGVYNFGFNSMANELFFASKKAAFMNILIGTTLPVFVLGAFPLLSITIKNYIQKELLVDELEHISDLKTNYKRKLKNEEEERFVSIETFLEEKRKREEETVTELEKEEVVEDYLIKEHNLTLTRKRIK